MAHSINWVLLRGWARESGHWGEFPEQFQRFLPGDRVVPWDYPGVGQRLAETSPLSIEALARDMLSSLKDYDPRHTVLVGHSMGGMVALKAAQAQKDLLGVVLINTSSAEQSALLDRLQLRSLREVIEIFLTPNLRQREERILGLVSKTPLQHQETVQKWIQLAQNRPVRRQVVLSQLWAASRFKLTSWPQSGPRSLVLASLGDDLVNPACSAAIADKLGVAPRYHPWAGHELTLDDPDWVLTEVQKWRSNL